MNTKTLLIIVKLLICIALFSSSQVNARDFSRGQTHTVGLTATLVIQDRIEEFKPNYSHRYRVNVNRTKIYSKSSDRSRVIDHAFKGQEIIVTGFVEGFARVIFDNQTAWVNVGHIEQ